MVNMLHNFQDPYQMFNPGRQTLRQAVGIGMESVPYQQPMQNQFGYQQPNQFGHQAGFQQPYQNYMQPFQFQTGGFQPVPEPMMNQLNTPIPRASSY